MFRCHMNDQRVDDRDNNDHIKMPIKRLKFNDRALFHRRLRHQPCGYLCLLFGGLNRASE